MIREPLNAASADWQAWTDAMRKHGRIIPNGQGGEWILNRDGRIVGGISTATFKDLNGSDPMTDELQLKLGRLASTLLLDLNEVDAIHYNAHSAANEQKAQLLVDALTEAVRIADTERSRTTCKVLGCDNSHTGLHGANIPDSLIDHGP